MGGSSMLKTEFFFLDSGAVRTHPRTLTALAHLYIISFVEIVLRESFGINRRKNLPQLLRNNERKQIQSIAVPPSATLYPVNTLVMKSILANFFGR